MIRDVHETGELVTRIQSAFIEPPRPALTAGAVQRRFAIDVATCRAILQLLVEARVLVRTAAGEYTQPLALQRSHRRRSRGRQRAPRRSSGPEWQHVA